MVQLWYGADRDGEVTLTRRQFLGGILAAGAAPALVKFESLMRPRSIWGTARVPLTFGGVELLELSTTNEAWRHTWRYMAEITLNVPSGRLTRLWADGHEVDRDLYYRDGVLHFKEAFDLTPFGNRVARLPHHDQRYSNQQPAEYPKSSSEP